MKEESDYQAAPPLGIDPIGASTDSTALLYKAIRDDIVSGRLTANQRLVVTDLAKRHGSSTTPVTFWVGSNHGASIVKLEPLD